MTRKWAGVKLVAHAPLKWTRDGELTAIEPGDIFEVDERDVEVAQIRFDLWLASGAVTIYREPAVSPEERTPDDEEGGNGMVDTPAPERTGKRPSGRSSRGSR